MSGSWWMLRLCCSFDEMEFMFWLWPLFLQTIILVILGVSTFFPIAFTGQKLYWRNRLEIARVRLLQCCCCFLGFNLLKLIPINFLQMMIQYFIFLQVFFFALLALDTIVNAIYVIPSGFISSLPFRLAPYLRVVIVVLHTRYDHLPCLTCFQRVVHNRTTWWYV